MIPLHKIPKEVEAEKEDDWWSGIYTRPIVNREAFNINNNGTYEVTFRGYYDPQPWADLRNAFINLNSTIARENIRIGGVINDV